MRLRAVFCPERGVILTITVTLHFSMARTGDTGVMIPIAKPLIDAAEADAAREAVLSGWVSQGPQVAAFEREFAAAVGAPHACAVSNCTTALHLALLAAGVSAGDEVITASHSFIASANSIRYCGAMPVFVDIDPATYNIDPARVAEAITGRTKAILVVHQMGMPCDLASLLPLAKRHGIVLIEDAACAIGSQVNLDGKWEAIGKPARRCWPASPSTRARWSPPARAA